MCPFCKNEVDIGNLRNLLAYKVDCPNCGLYEITDEAIKLIQSRQIKIGQLVNCISYNIENSRFNDSDNLIRWKTISEQNKENGLGLNLEDFISIEIDHSKKPLDLLEFIARRTFSMSPFSEVELTLSDLYYLKIESFLECSTWLNLLIDEGKLVSEFLGQIGPSERENWFANSKLSLMRVSLTPKGWDFVSKNGIKKNSKKVFIAMQFNWEQDESNDAQLYLNAVKSVCAEFQLEANIVDQNHNDYITEKIMSEIKNSILVIADFTFNNQGVYFEAGFARGLGKQVIHTVKEGHVKGEKLNYKWMHFDITQINYIKWVDVNSLKNSLRDRINILKLG